MDRIDRINQRIKELVSDIILSEVKDPRLGFVTITKVDVSRDLQHAKVFFSVLGNIQQVDAAEEGLNSARGFIRRLVGQRVRIRYTPEIMFYHDKSLEYSSQIDETLAQLKKDRVSDETSGNSIN